MDTIIQILRKEFSEQDWEITRSQGKSKESYIAESNQRKVFIKLEKISPALLRLSEIAAAPAIITSGQHHGIDYFIQDFIEGEYPTDEWFQEHIGELAAFIRRYHTDADLIHLLSDTESDYKKHINDEISYLEERLQKLSMPPAEIQSYFDRLKEMGASLDEEPFVPVHADTNRANFLVTPEGFVMVDWEDVMLSDNTRDIGMILFRYYRKDRWGDFWSSYGAKPRDEKIYFWIAAHCLGVAAWFGERGDEQSQNLYLDAFKAAVDGDDNPHFGKL